MLCRILPKKRKPGAVPVYLNVYDLTPINGYAYWLGLGVYHSGVQVHGVEYGFGAHDHGTTGIYEVEPKSCPGFTFRKSILVGRTDLGPIEVHSFMEKLSKQYLGNMYHLISKNCNHFCNDVSIQLTGKPIPRWVNRLARLGLLCKCVLPAGLNGTNVRHIKVDGNVSVMEKKKQVRSNSNRLNSPNRPTLPLSDSSSSSSSSSHSRRQKRCIPSSLSPQNGSSSNSVVNTKDRVLIL